MESRESRCELLRIAASGVVQAMANSVCNNTCKVLPTRLGLGVQGFEKGDIIQAYNSYETELSLSSSRPSKEKQVFIIKSYCLCKLYTICCSRRQGPKNAETVSHNIPRAQLPGVNLENLYHKKRLFSGTCQMWATQACWINSFWASLCPSLSFAFSVSLPHLSLSYTYTHTHIICYRTTVCQSLCILSTITIFHFSYDSLMSLFILDYINFLKVGILTVFFSLTNISLVLVHTQWI